MCVCVCVCVYIYIRITTCIDRYKGCFDVFSRHFMHIVF